MNVSAIIRAKLRLLLLLIIYPLLIVWFQLLEHFLKAKYITDWPIDAYIPFIPEFIIPYLSWFPLVAAVVAYFWITSPREYCRVLWVMYAGMAISLIIFMLFPNGQNLRPALGDGFFDQIVAGIYANDTPTDSLPSIHVLESILMFASMAESPKARATRWLVPVSGIGFFLVSISTVFVKQHAFADVVVAVVIAAILWYVFFRTSATDRLIDSSWYFLTPRDQRPPKAVTVDVPVEQATNNIADEPDPDAVVEPAR